LDRTGRRIYGEGVLRQLLKAISRALAPLDPEGLRHVKRLADQLNEKATQFRDVSSRVVLLEQRIGFLETDWKTWERRMRGAAHEPSLLASVARCLGRVEGQLQEARAEVATLQAEEMALRSLLTHGREEFARLLRRARALGYDVSSCLLYIDLTRPECPADDELLADDADRDFVARVIDGAGVH
jgi:chromosome segregation ATPase